MAPGDKTVCKVCAHDRCGTEVCSYMRAAPKQDKTVCISGYHRKRTKVCAHDRCISHAAAPGCGFTKGPDFLLIFFLIGYSNPFITFYYCLQLN